MAGLGGRWFLDTHHRALLHKPRLSDPHTIVLTVSAVGYALQSARVPSSGSLWLLSAIVFLILLIRSQVALYPDKAKLAE